LWPDDEDLARTLREYLDSDIATEVYWRTEHPCSSKKQYSYFMYHAHSDRPDFEEFPAQLKIFTERYVDPWYPVGKNEKKPSVMIHAHTHTHAHQGFSSMSSSI
jgi:hypothetical protein